MDCYFLNLDRSSERLERFLESFTPLGLNLIRVSAVSGDSIEFPHPEYSEQGYRLCHGKRTIPNEVGCYFSHLKALRAFLDTDQEHALICEDDVSAQPDLIDVLHDALRYRKYWDILRLNGLRVPVQVSIATLSDERHRLTVPLTWYGGTGAYMLNRKAAERLIEHLVPMRIPYDHALDHYFMMGLTTLMVKPYPIQLNETASISEIVQAPKHQNQYKYQNKLPFFQRYLTVLPYRAVMTSGTWAKQLGTAIKLLLKKPHPQQEESP